MTRKPLPRFAVIWTRKTTDARRRTILIQKHTDLIWHVSAATEAEALRFARESGVIPACVPRGEISVEREAK